MVEQICEESGSDHVVVYPLGEYPLNVRTSQDTEDMEPMIFGTVAERNAYMAGIEYGCHLCGAETAPISDEDLDTIDQMRAASTHGDGKKRLN